jgi:hypothetical protein
MNLRLTWRCLPVTLAICGCGGTNTTSDAGCQPDGGRDLCPLPPDAGEDAGPDAGPDSGCATTQSP